jgi:hypothetical protein
MPLKNSVETRFLAFARAAQQSGECFHSRLIGSGSGLVSIMLAPRAWASPGAPQVLRNGCHQELVAGAAEAAQSHSFEAKRGLEVREQYLNLLPLIPGLLELRCACQLTCVVAGFVMDATQDIAGMFGQQRALSSQESQSRLLARYLRMPS